MFAVLGSTTHATVLETDWLRSFVAGYVVDECRADETELRYRRAETNKLKVFEKRLEDQTDEEERHLSSCRRRKPSHNCIAAEGGGQEIVTDCCSWQLLKDPKIWKVIFNLNKILTDYRLVLGE